MESTVNGKDRELVYGNFVGLAPIPPLFDSFVVIIIIIIIAEI